MNATRNNTEIESRCLSGDEVRHFLEHRLDSDQYERVIIHMRDCEYCAEAVNGLEQLSDTSVLASLPATWQAYTGTGKRKQNAWGRTVKRHVTWLVTLALITLSGTGNERPVIDLPRAGPMYGMTAMDVGTGESEVLRAQRHQPVQYVKAFQSARVAGFRDMQPVSRLDKKEARIEAPLVAAPEYAMQKSHAAYPVIYIEGFKVFRNPVAFGSADAEPLVFGSHLPSPYESAGAMVAKEEDLSVIRYRQALAGALRSLAGGDHAAALSLLNSILDRLPGDLNATFYRGLALESAGRLRPATVAFVEAARHAVPVFNEEACFHMALCEYRMGHRAKANAMLQRIVEKDGYYRKRASVLLNGR